MSRKRSVFVVFVCALTSFHALCEQVNVLVQGNYSAQHRVTDSHSGSLSYAYSIKVPQDMRVTISLRWRSASLPQNCGYAFLFRASPWEANWGNFSGVEMGTTRTWTVSADTMFYVRVSGGVDTDTEILWTENPLTGEVYSAGYRYVPFGAWFCDSVYDIQVKYENRLPDLLITGLATKSRMDVMTDEDVDIRFAVRNVGTVNYAGKTAAAVYVDARQVGVVDVPLLDAGREWEVSFNVGSLPVGAHVITVMADSASNVKESFEDNNIATMSVNVYARTSYFVLFNSNDGTSRVSRQSFTCGVSQRLNPCPFRFDRHVFVGWSFEPNGVVAYRDEAEVCNLSHVEGGTVALYAIWKPRLESAVVFHANGGLGGDYLQVVTNGLDYVLLPCRFSKSRDVFSGWANSSSDAAICFDQQHISNHYRGEIFTNHLYAVWGTRIEGSVACMPTFTGGDRPWRVSSIDEELKWTSFWPEGIKTIYYRWDLYGYGVFKNGDVDDGESSWLQMNVNGGGMISFDWRSFIPKGEPGAASGKLIEGAYLYFMVDGVVRETFSGWPDDSDGRVDGWRNCSVDLEEGDHVLVWSLKRFGPRNADWCNSFWIKSVFWSPCDMADVNRALDCENLRFRNGGDGMWFAQRQFAHDGREALESGFIQGKHSSWIETDLAGAGMLSFWWRALSTSYYNDVAALLVDGVQVAAIAGTRDGMSEGWKYVSVPVGAGNHKVQWRFSVDHMSVQDYLNSPEAVWLDEVSWRPQDKSFEVVYDGGQHGIGPRTEVIKVAQAPLRLDRECFARSGYVQTGWSLRSDGGTKDYDIGSVYAIDAPVVLYPYWSKNVFDATLAIVFIPNGGMGSASPLQMETGRVCELPKCTFTPPAGKHFAGWACSNGRRYDDGMLVFDLAQPGETVTMTAIWE